MKRYYLVVTVLIVFTACKQKNVTSIEKVRKPTVITSVPKANELKKTDTLIVDKRCAVDYWAPQEKMDQMEKEGGDGFYVASDDVGWYIYESTTYLDSMKLPAFRTKGYRYIRFKKDNNTSVYIDTDTIQGIAHIYLFDPAKDPVTADITDMRRTFSEYFDTE